MPPRRRNTAGSDGNGTGQVYGPRSALTSFLREQGITGPGANVTYINRRQGTLQRTPSSPSSSAQQDGDSSAAGADVDVSTAVTMSLDPSASGSASAEASTSASPAASTSTDANAEAGPSSASSSAVASKRKGKPLSAAAQKKAKKAALDAHNAGFGEDGMDDFSVGGKQVSQPKKGRYEGRVPGQIKVCGECGKKFTVSKYTATNPNGPGLLCAPCTSESIEDRATFPSAGPAGGKKGAAKDRPAAPKRKKSEKAVEETKYTVVPTLQQGCLSIIATFISSVETGAFSYLGPKNLDRIAKIVSKNRALDGENLKLFLEVGHRELRLYDCTNIHDHHLSTISTFSPHLVSLTLLQCGRLDDDVLTAWAHPVSGFKELRNLELYAPYLVTAAKWSEFWERRKEIGAGELESFKLRMSSRFTPDSLLSTLTHNSHLHTLQLSELGKLPRDALSLLARSPLAQNKTLRRLDISRWGTPQGMVLEDEDVVGLLREVGEGLEELVLDGNYNLTSATLTDGIAPYCRNLTSLSLANLSKIDSEGLEALFRGQKPRPATTTPAVAGEGEGQGEREALAEEAGETSPEKEGESEETAYPPWSPAGLTLLNAHRLTDALTAPTLSALLSHSSHSLQHLNLHSADQLDGPALALLAKEAKALEVLDVSFVRAVDNFVVKDLLDGCAKLRVAFLHGNNRVTSDVPRKHGVQLRGLENAVHSEIPGGIPWEC
ncbi:hypothetical protein JCM8097_001179 [Rhodosporidiobolus ruineniae]